MTRTRVVSSGVATQILYIVHEILNRTRFNRHKTSDILFYHNDSEVSDSSSVKNKVYSCF